MALELTKLGESRAKIVGTVRDPENAVIAYMYETKEPVEVEEIAGETNMTNESTERVVARLISKGYIREL